MAEDKQQTLTNLYSLRAGISAVASERNKVEEINSQTADEVANLEGKIKQNERQKSETEKYINYLNNKIVRDKKNINNKMKEYNKYVNYYERDSDSSDIVYGDERIKMPSIRQKHRLKANYDTLKLLIPIAISLVYLIIFFSVPLYKEDLLPFALFVISIILTVVAFLVGGYFLVIFIALLRDIPDDNAFVEKKFDELTIEYNRIKSLIDSVSADENTIRSSKKQIEEYENNIKQFGKEIEQCKTAAEQACKPHYQLGGMIQQQFEEQFGSFLNLGDWKNTDIIIYAYESGRVETMKEALTYADEETRTDRIVNAVNASTQAVCRSIQSGLHSLALSMGQCFSVISRQIAEQTNKLERISTNLENLSLNTANLSASIAENTASNAESLANLAAKVDYANALQEQRNKSSNELVEKNEVFMLEARNVMHDIYTNRY